jgi:hypothetical protein
MYRQCRSERGSIPMVLLMSIVVGGLVVVLIAAVMVNQRTTRFDRSFTSVVQPADEHVQEAAHHIIRGDWDPDRTASVGTQEKNYVGATCTADSDGEVCWTATKVTPLSWEIEATVAARTTAGEVATRTVKTNVVDLPRFFVAAFADTQMRLRGGNDASSYGDGTWSTGNGIIASNEDVLLSGSDTNVDGVQLYNWDNYNDLNRCIHTGGNDCDDVLAMPEAVAPSGRFGPELVVGGPRLQTAFIDDAIAACEAVTSPLSSYTSSTNGSVLSKATFPKCVENLTFDTDITVLDGPIEVYVKGQFSVTNGVSVNCPVGGCAVGSGDPDATNLRVFSAGGDVTIGNNTKVVGGIYAPESDCSGNPSNAQGEIYGSMICGTIENNGGWQFNYDDDLQGVGSGAFEMTNYRED